ncbi:purine-nucleoside phosphorylase [Pontibacter sp. G13]|uniref:purine-nucleoside phosphorylase n=1 Tax=Pontibacter sp. G13 TaxID=3074898 RepID=UPI00288BE594|nr:purine-nucleoside phosphorylase [Pontibacter sp. G13]WNJ16233.1 purine-nucleoside phosphorylase [Pontibacter sp. G13]
MEKKLTEAFEYIRKQYSGTPEIGIVLGTGLGGLVAEIEEEKVIPYNFIPHFPISTVESHFGKLIFGKIGDKPVVAMQGRFHYYEGYSMQEITFPIRIMKMLGIHTLFISNASGGMNLDYKCGDLMIIDDHINLQNANPLVGPNMDEFGPRFPDMSRPYDPELIQKAEDIAGEKGYRVHKGVYVGVTGPNLETRAEYRFLHRIGADVVGMSTVPEVIVARHMDLRVCAISVITDECDPDDLHPVSIEDVIAVANEAEPKLTDILATLIKGL